MITKLLSIFLFDQVLDCNISSFNHFIMKKISFQAIKVSLIFLPLFIISSCASIALYDDYSFKQTVDGKVQTIDLMKKSVQPYAEHATEVEDLMNSLQKVYEYDKRRTDNQLSTKMWDVLLDPDQFLVAGFFKKWKDQGPQNQAFVDEAVKQVEEGFNYLLDFEGAKDKTAQNRVGALINSFVSNL